eukprot:jgi/Tetstr1/427455/TSEL_001754.t2
MSESVDGAAAELIRCEQLLRGRAKDIEAAGLREAAASARVDELGAQGTHSLAPTTPTIGPANSSLLQSTSALTSPFFASRELPSVSTPLELRRGRIKRQRCVQVDKLQKQVAEQRQEGGKLLAEVSRLRAEGGQAAQRGAREVARLKWELETERATCRELTENNQSFIAKVATLQERCSSLEDARREVVGLRGKLAEMAKGRAESMTIAATANAEAELLRVQVKELSDALSRTLRHAQAHEAELAGEREALRVKTEELEQQQARLQDDLAAVKAAGVLSKSGTMRFEIGGALSSLPSGSSRPSTAEGPDEQYRLSKQVRELQDRLRLQQGQLLDKQAAVEAARARAEAEAAEAAAGLRQENSELRVAVGRGEVARRELEAALEQARSGDQPATNTSGREEMTAAAAPAPPEEVQAEAAQLRAELVALRQVTAGERAALRAELAEARQAGADAHTQAEARGHEVVGLQVRDLHAALEEAQPPGLRRMGEVADHLAGLSAALEEEGRRSAQAMAHISEQNRLITALQGKIQSLEGAAAAAGANQSSAWGGGRVASARGAPAPAGATAADMARPHTAPWPSGSGGTVGGTVGAASPGSRGHTVDTVRLLRRSGSHSSVEYGSPPRHPSGGYDCRSQPVSPAVRGKRIASAWTTLSTGGLSPSGQRMALSGALRGSTAQRSRTSAGGGGGQQGMTLF